MASTRSRLRRGVPDRRNLAGGDSVGSVRPAGVEHNIINANAGEFAFIEIELK
jgi:hypothetical protein